jgi:hypothetical protein
MKHPGIRMKMMEVELQVSTNGKRMVLAGLVGGAVGSSSPSSSDPTEQDKDVLFQTIECWDRIMHSF